MSLAWTGDFLDASSTLDVAIGNPGGEPAPAAVDPRREYVSVGPPDIDRGYLAIERGFGGPLAWHGVAEYERMYHTPAVGASVNAIRAAVLANPVSLLPAVKRKSSLGRPGQVDGTEIEADMAAEIADSNRRTLDAWRTPVDAVLWESMEDLWLGHVLGEIVADDVAGGPDDGLLAVVDVKFKPRNSYRFKVDQANNLLAINALSFDADTGQVEWKEFRPEHFAISTNDPHRGDPRGRSAFRMAHYHWRLLMDLWPEVYKGWKQFGVPMLYGTTAPGAKMVPRVGKDGVALTGNGVTAEFAMSMNIGGMVNGARSAGPNGSDIKVIESRKDSSVVSGAVTILEAQIKQSIILAIRATTEAEHGSKADSGTAQDVMGTLVRFQRKRRERYLRSILMRQNAWNYGEDLARRLTPLVDLGGTEHQDFAANSAGVATLYQSSYFSESQLPYVDTFLGLPQRQPGDRRVGPAGIVPDEPPVDPNAPPAPAPEPAPGGGP